MERLSPQIAAIRKSVLNISQQRLGEIVGVSQGTVSKWEAGTLSPDLTELSRLRAELRRVRPDWNDTWFFEPFAPVNQMVA